MAYDARGQLQNLITYAATTSAGAGIADGSQSITQYVYSQSGNLLQTISATGGVTQYTYDGLGRVLSSSGPEDQLTLTQYDDASNKTRVTVANGLSTTSTYDQAGRLVSVVQADASAAALGETKYFYDAAGRLRMTQSPTGAKAWMLYDEASRKVADIDADGSLVEYSYDASNRLVVTAAYVTAVDVEQLIEAQSGQPVDVSLASLRAMAMDWGQAVWRIYDDAGRLWRMVEVSGFGSASVTENSYDGASRLIQTTQYANLLDDLSGFGNALAASAAAPAADPMADRVVRHFYDGDGNLLASLDGEGYLTESQYDSAQRLAATVRYATATTASLRATGTLDQLRPAPTAADIRHTALYDGKGQVIAEIDGENRLTEKVYDNNGSLVTTVRYATNLAGPIDSGAALASVRPPGAAEDQVTTWVYDDLGRAVRQTNAEGTVTDYRYDNVGNLVATTSAVGQAEVRSINSRFDLQGRLVGELTAEGSALLVAGLTSVQIDAVWQQYGLAHTYDAAGRRTSTTDQNGHKTLFFYDTDGRLTHSINALGEVEEREYNALNQQVAGTRYGTRISLAGLIGGSVSEALTSRIDAIRNSEIDSRTLMAYYADGRMLGSIDALGNGTQYAYNAFGEEIARASFDSSGNEFSVRLDSAAYDRRGLQVSSVSDAVGVAATTHAIYDAFGRLTQSVDANGNVRVQSFDRSGRVIQTIDPGNVSRSTTYDAFDRAVSTTDGLGQVTRYAYDTAARSVTITSPEGVTVTTVRTRHGQTLSVTDGENQVTSYAYDRNGNLTSTTTSLTATEQSFDRSGRLIETVDARGNAVAYAYDAANRVLTRSVDPAGLQLVTSYSYDAKGQQVSVTDPNGVVTSYVYDLKGRVLRQSVDPSGLNLQTSFTYDARGRTLSVTSPGGTFSRYTYDKLGRRIQEQIDPAGLNISRSFAYDDNGNTVSSTDANGHVTRYVYDGSDRLLFSVDATGSVQERAYDDEGRLVRTTRYVTPIDVNGLPAALQADDVNDLLTSVGGKDSLEANRYDRDGRLRFMVDGTGAVTEFGYDGNGNVVERIAYARSIDLSAWNGDSDPAVVADASRDQRLRTVYDALGRAVYVADALGAVTQNVYDENGNLVRAVQYATPLVGAQGPSEVTHDPVADRVTVYAYDAANREVARADAMGAVRTTRYDDNGNVIGHTDHATPIQAGGLPSSVPPVGADRTEAFYYDAANRLAYSVDALGAVTGHEVDGEGRVVSTTQYATQIGVGQAPSTVASTPADRTASFAYDAAGRLTSSTDALGATESFEYDGQGNKVSFTNKKQSVWTYEYDAAGRLVTEVSPTVDLTSVAVNAAGNLTEGATLNAPVVTKLGYDGVGNLLTRTEAFSRLDQRTTTYAYDARGRQIGVTYPPVGVYSESTAALGSNGQSGLAARSDATRALSTRTFYDALGNAVANVDVAGSVSFKSYDAAGRVVFEVDALGFVTGYNRNVFGEAETVTRFANATTLAGTQPQSAAQAPTAAQVHASVNAAGIDHAADRHLQTGYDKAGRAVMVVEPTTYTYDAEIGQYDNAGKTTRNTYNAFGELTAASVLKNRLTNVWNTAYHYYDHGGRQTAGIDALGYLTTRNYDRAGNLTRVVEHANAATSWSASAYTAAARVANDRETTYAYDKADRKISETRVQVEVSASPDGTSTRANLTTTYGYDAVGNLTRTTDAAGGSVYSYYDALGRVTAVAAPARNSTASGSSLTPLTIFRRDAYGNVVAKIERASTASSATEFTGVSSASSPGFVAPAPNWADRATNTKYDSQGHAIQVTDATGASQFTSYNERGQVAKIWQEVTGNDAQTSTAFQVFQYDKLGQLTATLDPAPLGSLQQGLTAGIVSSSILVSGESSTVITGTNGIAVAWAGLTDPTGGRVRVQVDYQTVAVPGGAGSATATRTNEFDSDVAAGGVTFTWDDDASSSGGVQALSYVRVWQWSGSAWTMKWEGTPQQAGGASIVNGNQASAGVVTNDLEYNAFGEVARKGLNGGRQEYFDYDNAGRLWRTNSGDGAAKIVLYDLEGRATADIRSSGSGRDDRDLSLLSIDQVAALATTRRTETRYDALGRVVAKIEAERQDRHDGLTVSRQLNTATVASSATAGQDEASATVWSGTNRLDFSWTSLAGLGSGDVKVQVDYLTAAVRLTAPTYDESGAMTSPGTFTPVVAGTRSGIFSAEEAASGTSLTWSDAANSASGGIGSVTRLTVLKKDALGVWRTVVDRSAFGFAGNTIDVAAPNDPDTEVRLEMRAAGSTGAWTSHPLVDFGGALRYDASGMVLGAYEYRVVTAVRGQPEQVTASGTIQLTNPALASIGVSMSYGPSGAGVLSWATQGNAVTQTLRYRVAGSGTAWSALPVTARGNGYDGADTSPLGAGTYEFELLWTHASEGAPYAHATGSFTVTAAIAPVYVPPVGSPNLGGLAIAPTGGRDVPQITGYDESGNPIYARDESGAIVNIKLNGIHWNLPASGAGTFRYRVAGSSSWSTLPITNVQQYGTANVAGLAPGSYDFSVEYAAAGATLSHGTGTLTVHPQGAGYYETVTVTVQVPVTVTPPDPANYIVSYTRNTYSHPVFVGTDESGNPILGAHYAWSGHVVVGVPYTVTGITGYQSQQVPVYGNVTVNPPNPANYITGYTRPTYSYPVFTGYNESGTPILGAHYAWSGNAVVAVPYSQYQIVRYETVQVPYQVPVRGAPIINGYDESGNPIYARDENGNIAYHWTYRTEYRSETRPVYGWVTITPPNPNQYLTVAAKPIYGYPVVIGTNESGQPILGAHYAWSGSTVVGVPYTESQIVRYEWQDVPVYGPVTVSPPNPAQYLTAAGKPVYGSPVVIGTDESGQPILAQGYSWQGNQVIATPYTVYQPQQQQQQVWREGTTPPPTVSVTTPAYTPGYTIPGTPKQYSVNVSSSPGTVSTSEGGVANASAQLTQNATLNGASTWLRPAVYQTVDRWGNVTQTSDPRFSSWTTQYRYNASNQLVEEIKQPTADAPVNVTRYAYDALGRNLAVADANGRVNGQVFDAAGNLVEERHADGGVVTHRYNAFGDRVWTSATHHTTRATAGSATSYAYDEAGRLLSITRGVVNVWGVGSSSSLTLVDKGQRAIVESFTYDQMGRKLTQTNGEGETTAYKYDLAGRVIEITQPLGQKSRKAYDALGRQMVEIDANGMAATWSYNYFGQLSGHTDIGGARYSYSYDQARQLIGQANTRGQDLRYAYDAAGQLVRSTDQALGKVSTYAYDLAGNRVVERTEQDGVVYQDNHLAYDELNRLRQVSDSRASVSFQYDAVGNRTYVGTHVNVAASAGDGSSDVSQDTHRYFRYDEMNRQTVVDAVDAAGNLGQQGHAITYDLNGNRTEDKHWGNRVTTAGGEQLINYFDESGAAVYYTTPVTFHTDDEGLTIEKYSYDVLNRLTSVVRDGVQVDLRRYDGAGRLVQNGPNGNLPQGYAAALNAGVAQGESIGLETRRNRFDANGRLLHQTVLKSDNALSQEIDYGSHDAAGNVLQYAVTVPGEYTNTYRHTLERFEGYQQARIDGSSTEFDPGRTINGYDVNGQLVAVTDTTQPANNRSFVNDAEGRALFVKQGEHVQRQLVVNGEVLARYGVGIDEVTPRTGDGTPNFAPGADFNFGYQPIHGNYPGAGVGSYTVAAGDTLRAIARGAYGDEKLWYRIAEANGLGSDRDLRVGQTLTIPNAVGTVHNDAGSYKPYDPSRITGDLTPNLPVPSAGGGCGAMGQIIMLVVAVAVTVYTAGVMGGQAGSGFAATMKAGGAAIANASAATAGTIAAASAAGSIASQIVGNAIGAQDGFSWKQVALSAIGGWAGSQVPASLVGQSQVTNVMVRAAVGNAASQGIGVVTGLQDQFNWKGVAASAIGAGVATAVAPAFSQAFGNTAAGQFGTRLATSLVAGTAAALARGGKVAVQQVAVDAFGNALGYSLAQSSNDVDNPGGYDYENEMDRQSDAAHVARLRDESLRTSGDFARMDGVSYRRDDDALRVNGLTFSQDAALRQLANNPYGLPTQSSGVVVRDFDPENRWDPDALVPVGADGSPTVQANQARSFALPSAPAPTLTADDWQRQGEGLYRQAKTLSQAAKWASSNRMEAAAVEYAQKATEASAAGDQAINMAGRINISNQARSPQNSGPFAAGWNTGEYSAGTPYPRGTHWPDYATVQGNFYVASGGISVNLHNGDVFGQWSLGRAYPAFGIKPGITLVTGTIIDGRGAEDTNEFLGGASWQAGGFYPVPLAPLIGVGGGLNHSYGGKTAIETGISVPPGYQASPFGYGFEWNASKPK